jgi:hypothetical protein
MHWRKRPLHKALYAVLLLFSYIFTAFSRQREYRLTRQHAGPVTFLFTSVHSYPGLPSHTPTVPDLRLSRLDTSQSLLLQTHRSLSGKLPITVCEREPQPTSLAPDFCLAFGFMISSCNCRQSVSNPGIPSGMRCIDLMDSMDPPPALHVCGPQST